MSSEIRDILAADVDPEPVEWLLDEPRIPRRGISIVVGFRGATKTTVACWLAAQATARGLDVFFASQEDDIASFVRPRMEAAGADLDRVRFPDEDDPPLRFPADAERLARYVNERSTALVLLDPLSAFVPTFTNPAAVRDALSPLGRISRQHDCAITFVHHFRKSGGKTAFDAMGGAGALTDVARAVYVYGKRPDRDPIAELLFGTPDWYAAKDEDDGDDDPDAVRVLAPLKLSAAELPPSLIFRLELVNIPALADEVPRMTLFGETSLSGEALFAGQLAKADGDADSMIEQAVTFLLHYLVDGAQPVQGLNGAAKEAGITARTLERARARLKTVTFQEDSRWWVKLPELDAPPEEWSR